MTSNSFICHVHDSLVSLGVDFEILRKEKKALGLGLSGGADSVSLFRALEVICKEENVSLVCVTVNHHIRKAEETDGDMNFVINLVKSFSENNPMLCLEVFDLPEDRIEKLKEQRKNGVEDAARFVRYECFEKAAKKHNISFFCLAHNKNDHLETILMRFLQGSTVCSGIEARRDMYIRPLLDVSRKEIEDFLFHVGQDYVTDSTNLSDEYFRNKIRHKMIPLLESEFPSWESSVLSGSSARKEDSEYIDKIAENTPLSSELFKEGNEPLCDRVLIRYMNLCGETKRIPKNFLRDFQKEVRKSFASGKSFSKVFGICELCFSNGEVFVKRFEKKQTDKGFFDIIEEEGEYFFPFGKVEIRKNKKGMICISSKDFSETITSDFPFVIRSPVIGESGKQFIVEG